MERFADKVSIFVSSGKGGSGKVSFEKTKVHGLADGGNGGNGGDVYISVCKNIASLAHIRNGEIYKAAEGGNGGSTRKCGARGEALNIIVPVGTMVFHTETGQKLVDCVRPDEKILLLHGGRGGKGNAHFKSSRMRSPRFAQDGEMGYALNLRLEFRLLLDCVLIGMPNSGKSALLRAVTGVDVPVADYPYTTEVPMHATLINGYTRVHLVELPAIEMRTQQTRQRNLGLLRHAWRASIIIYLIEAGDGKDYRSFLKSYQSLLQEQLPDLQLEGLYQYLIITKKDLLASAESKTQLERDIAAIQDDLVQRVYSVSTVNMDGVQEVKDSILTDIAS